MAVNVTTWMRGLGLERCATAFVENEVDELSLPILTAEDLRDLGVASRFAADELAGRNPYRDLSTADGARAII